MKESKTLTEKIIDKKNSILEKKTKKLEDKLISDLASKLSMYELIDNHFGSKIEKLSPLKINTKKTRVLTNRTLCVLMSDLHIGKKSYSYDFDIFKTKLESLQNQIIDNLTEKNITKLCLFFDGDFCDGFDIYPGQHNYICLDIAQQAILGAEVLSNFVSNISKFCSNIDIHCISGNHGRMGKKGESNLRQNWDAILYNICKVHLKNFTNVNFEIYEDWKAFIKVEQMTLMVFHGDDIGPGNPVVSIPNAIVKWSDMMRNEIHFDASLCGHFHIPVLSIDVNGREMFINSSFVPSDEYVEKKIKSKSRTGQVCFIIENNKIKDRNLLEV